MKQKKKVQNEKPSAVYEKIVFCQEAYNKVEEDRGQPDFDNIKK